MFLEIKNFITRILIMAYAFIPYSLKQNYEDYTSEDFAVWHTLFERQMKILPSIASKNYLGGIEKVEFTADKIPNYAETNKILERLTGWQIHVVPGHIENKPFFELMRAKNFCASTWLRKRDQLDYLQEPDMFHDTFGHVPMLSDKNVCNFLEELGRIALRFIDDAQCIECISRIYWYTIEFGLIKEDNALKIYGAGILSSSGESEYSVHSAMPKRLPFNVETIINTPFKIDAFQEIYFVLESYEQLFNSVADIEKNLENIYSLAHH